MTSRVMGIVLIAAAAAGCGDTSAFGVDGGEVAALEVTPATASIGSLNGTRQLSATARDADGVIIDRASIGWTSLNPAIATVDGTGKVTSKAVGTVLIVAAASGFADTASITVTSGTSTQQPPPPTQQQPPPSGSGPGANEPTGFTPVFNYGGTTREVGGNFSNWWPSNRVQHVTDVQAPNGQAVELQWPAGTGTGGPVTTWKDWGRAYNEVYLRAVVKWSPNWQRHPGGDKMTYFGLKYYKDQGSATQMFFALRGSGWPAEFAVARQVADIQPGPQEQWITPAVLNHSGYHEIEVWIKAQSSPAARDGQIKVWIDGVLHDLRSTSSGHKGTHVTDARFVATDAGDVRFEGIQWQPYWGGSGGTKTQDDYMRWGVFYMSGK